MKRTAQTQQGMALIEALIASAVLGIGLVGATQLTLKTLNTASQNRQHTVAQHLAQEAMDCLHVQARTGITLCPPQASLLVQGVRYEREARSKPRGDGTLIDLQVRVQWAAPGNASGTASYQHTDWHSSASSVPGWLGVSSP
jgi:Tfp pilus assembly protein PilV